LPIIENLLSNAIKFSDPQKEVVVSARENGSGIEISVKDNGPGITAVDRGKNYTRNTSV